MNYKPIALSISLLFASAAFAQSGNTEIMIVGSDHFSQIYKKDFPDTDIRAPKAQQEITAFSANIIAFQPDLVAVEQLPERQQEIDSLYALYLQGRLDLQTLEDGRSELYQIAFRVAKVRKLKKVYCVNTPGGTSQSILDNGHNIEIYKEEGRQLRAFAVAKATELQNGVIGFYNYLKFLNQPAIAKKAHHLRYITPARVTDGTFKNPDAMIDTVFINPHYIGAELTATFKNRDYKIYSNIVNAQMQTGAKRILLVIGVAQLWSLQNI